MRTYLATAAGIAVSLSAACAFAQSSVDRSFTTTSNDCSGVQWSEEMKQRYPDLGSACQSVEERNGKKYVKFEGTVRDTRNRGSTLNVDFRGGGRVQMQPPEGTTIFMDGKPISVAQLQRGDRLTFYVPEDRMTAQFYPDEQLAAAEESDAVNVPIAATEQATPEEQESDRMAGTLPSTASGLPWVALSGFLMLGVAGALRFIRRRSRY